MEADTHILELVQYTDPYCTWCWGSEPVMRHIEEVYGGQVRFGFVLGGLVKDISAFYDPLNRIGGADMSRQVADHWREASERHGMPVDADVWLDMKNDFRSTWPANIAVKAAQLVDEEPAARYLRRLREAAAAERLPIHRRPVQVELAEEVGLDRERFVAVLDSGEAEAAFQEDLRECRRKHITGFPSFLIRNRQGEELMFFGFQPFSEFQMLFGRLAGEELAARQPVADDESIVSFARRYGKVAPREVAEVFSLDAGEADQRLRRLAGEGMLSLRPAGNGAFYSLSTTGPADDG